MRIAFLHMTMGLVDRGAERAVDLISTGLSQKHQVMLFHAGSKLTGKKYASKRTYNLATPPPVAPSNILDKIIFRLYLDKSSREVIKFTLASINLIKVFNPDIIVCINGKIQLKIIKAYFPSIKTVVFGEAGIGYHDIGTLKTKPDLYIALTEYAKNWASKYISKPTQVITIPNPIPTKVAKSNNVSLDLPSPIVLTVGALSKYKNINQVVKAISKIPASFVLVGDGELEAEVVQSLSMLPNHFKWIKHLEPSELMSLYQAVDAFCFVPQPQEAFGNVFIEAMSAGLPIVAPDDPIRREMIGSKGIYCDPSSPEEIRDGIIKALEVGKQKYVEELSKYKLNNVTKQIEAAFYDLLK